MHLKNWSEIFLTQWQHTTWAEWIAVLFGVASVLFSLKNKVWLYPTGIISTGIYAVLLSRSHYKLYAEALLNGYYLVMSVYGWWHWVKGHQPQLKTLPISYASRKEGWTAVAITTLGWVIFYLLLHHFTDSDVAHFDAFVSASACAGMWLLAKKKIENWLWLNVSNLVAITLLFYKKLPLTGCLTIFLFVVAIMGYLNWKKMYRQEQMHKLRA